MNVQAVRRRDIYHVQYDDGDSGDFDLDECRYAFELRQAIDTGVEYVRAKEAIDDASEVGTPEPKKRGRQRCAKRNVDESALKKTRVKKEAGVAKRNVDESALKNPRVKKAAGVARPKKPVKKMNIKTYTLESVLVEFDAESEYGKALRAMPESDMQVAVAKFKKGATAGIKGAVKAKVLLSKYSTVCKDKLKEHLLVMRVNENDMFKKAARKLPL
jgi:hypothetical protein